MKIEGDTIVFKSYKQNYEPEERGEKCCTVRVIPDNEWQDVLDFIYAFVTWQKGAIRIRITLANDSAYYFERQITHVQILGEILYSKLLLFCWRHEEAIE